MSATFDYGRRMFEPWIQPTIYPTTYPTIQPNPRELKEQVDRFEKLVKEFKALVAASKKFDAATGQPDCEDPDKAKLMDRIEKRLQEMRAGR